MSELLSDLWMMILEFCDNETIYNSRFLSRQIYNIIFSTFFQEYISYRYHPITFNIIDNYCTICNTGIIILDDELEILRCNHS